MIPFTLKIANDDKEFSSEAISIYTDGLGMEVHVCIYSYIIYFISATGCRTTRTSVPLTTAPEFEEVYSEVMNATLSAIYKDPLLNDTASLHGRNVTEAAKTLLEADDCLDVLKPHLQLLWVSEKTYVSRSMDLEAQRAALHVVRCNQDLRKQYVRHITTMYVISEPTTHMLFAKLMSHFMEVYVQRQVNIIKQMDEQRDREREVLLDEEDKDVIAYISGYIVQRVAKRESRYREGLSDALGSRTPHVDVPNAWISKLSRGGLCYPKLEFYKFANAGIMLT